MSKRPSLVTDLMRPAAKAAASAPEQESISETPTRRVANPDVKHTSVYIPVESYERLRELAFTQRCKINDLLLQGIDRVLNEHGFSGGARKR